MKRIPKTALTSELGVNLIQKIVLEMGCMWYPTGGTEAGIDGTIEIVDLVTGEATNQVLTVQSKATTSFQSETAKTVEFTCKERDLAYWLRGNTPVILVYSNPRTNEAYWVSIKDYFADPKTRASRKIRFNKRTDRFDANARSALERIIVPKGSGLYLGSPPRREVLHSDLIPLRAFPSVYYTAPTEYRSRHEIIAILIEEQISLAGVWTVRNKIVYSLDPLDSSEWALFCEQGGIEKHEEFDTWALSDETERKKLFVELLNLALKNQLYDQGLLFEKDEKYFFEKPHPDLAPKEVTYESRSRKASRSTFKGYKASAEATTPDYYRHAAFKARFMRFTGKWYLQIEATYHFTKNGKDISALSATALAGIKRLENNQAVHGQVLMWARRLQQPTNWDARPRKLFFGEPLKFNVDTGFEDDSWLKADEANTNQTEDSEQCETS
jgi:Domain of unknown function (DUF4365)